MDDALRAVMPDGKRYAAAHDVIYKNNVALHHLLGYTCSMVGWRPVISSSLIPPSLLGATSQLRLFFVWHLLFEFHGKEENFIA